MSSKLAKFESLGMKLIVVSINNQFKMQMLIFFYINLVFHQILLFSPLESFTIPKFEIGGVIVDAAPASIP